MTTATTISYTYTNVSPAPISFKPKIGMKWVGIGDPVWIDGLLVVNPLEDNRYAELIRVYDSNVLPNEKWASYSGFSIGMRKVFDKNGLFIYGFDTSKATQLTFPVQAEHEVGDIETNNLRMVYELVTKKSGLPIRCGVTIHSTLGSWSSWPPHKYETETGYHPDWDEKFAIMIDPEDGWGVIAYNVMDKYGLYEYGVTTIRNGEIISVPMGSHPIVAGPGCRLAYVWAYYQVGNFEKFEDGHRD